MRMREEQTDKECECEKNKGSVCVREKQRQIVSVSEKQGEEERRDISREGRDFSRWEGGRAGFPPKRKGEDSIPRKKDE